MDGQMQILEQIIRSRQKQFPFLRTDQSNISETLVSLFSSLDERYFQLSNQHIALKQELERKTLRLDEIEPQYLDLTDSKLILHEENVTLKKQIADLNSKLYALEQTNLINEGKLNESSLKIQQQEKLLIDQSEELTELAQKCTQLQQSKYSLSQKIKQITSEKELIKKSLNEEIMQIQNVRQRQKTQIHDVTLSIEEYQLKLNSLKQENTQLEQELNQAESEIRKLKDELQTSRHRNNSLCEQNNLIKSKCEVLEQNNKELITKEQQLESIKDEYCNLKEKEGNFDMILQNLSSEKQKLNREINRMTIEAKGHRKHSDSESINTDTAFQNMTESFRVRDNSKTYIHIEEPQDLNKSFQEVKSRKLSMSLNTKHGMGTSQLAFSQNQDKIQDLQNIKKQLENTICNLKQQLQDVGLINSKEPSKSHSASQERQLVVTQKQSYSEKGDQQKESGQINQTTQNQSGIHRVIEKFNISISPQIRLYSLFSIPAVKIKPKHKIEQSSQTSQKFEEPYFNKPYPQIKLSFDQVEISHKSSSTKKEQSFFDRLSRMFCGGPEN